MTHLRWLWLVCPCRSCCGRRREVAEKRRRIKFRWQRRFAAKLAQAEPGSLVEAKGLKPEELPHLEHMQIELPPPVYRQLVISNVELWQWTGRPEELVLMKLRDAGFDMTRGASPIHRWTNIMKDVVIYRQKKRWPDGDRRSVAVPLFSPFGRPTRDIHPRLDGGVWRA